MIPLSVTSSIDRYTVCPATDIAKMLGGSRATVYRYLSDGASLVA